MTTKLTMLTTRERDVFRLIVRGASNNEIAAELHLTLHTVKNHVSHILTKFTVRDRMHLIVTAYEHGFVVPAAQQASR